METQKTLELSFATANGKQAKVIVPNPKENMEPKKIADAMDNVITEGIFTQKNGAFIEKEGARLITRSIQDVKL